MAFLYIVSTPIGNMGDITLRALDVLRGVDLILCEDTRVTKKLLEFYEIKKPVLSYYQHSHIEKIDYILKLLKDGKNLAMVSDAGTPGILDPGGKLIECLNREMPKLNIVPVPGPSDLAAAACISGFAMDRFCFFGFPPNKKKRQKFFAKIAESEIPAVFYESNFRIIKSLEELDKELKVNGKFGVQVVVCRELTKKFESIYRGTIEKIIGGLKSSSAKGEFAVIVKTE